MVALAENLIELEVPPSSARWWRRHYSPRPSRLGDLGYLAVQEQPIEIRTGGTASTNVTSQTVWSAAYVNAAVLQDTYSAGVIQPNSRIYFQQDANWNTTAIVGYDSTTQTWGVTQRYVYDSYGNVTVLNADWSTPPAGTNPIVNNLYQGMTFDPVTGLYYERNRNYSSSLGTWTSQDPAGYINGANTYQFVMSNPVGSVDASGEFIAGAIWGGISGGIGGFVGASSSGGGFWTDIGGAVIGGAIGGLSGFIFPVGTGWTIAASGLTGAAANLAGQTLAQGFNNVNIGEVSTSGIVGALGEGILAPVDKALADLGDAATAAENALFNGMNSIFKGLLKGVSDALAKKLSQPSGKRKCGTKGNGGVPSKQTSPPAKPVPTNNFMFRWNPGSNGPGENYQQWSDGSWSHVGQTGGQ